MSTNSLLSLPSTSDFSFFVCRLYSYLSVVSEADPSIVNADPTEDDPCLAFDHVFLSLWKRRLQFFLANSALGRFHFHPLLLPSIRHSMVFQLGNMGRMLISSGEFFVVIE